MDFVGVMFEPIGIAGTRVVQVFSVPWTEAAALELFRGSLENAAPDKGRQQLWAAAVYRDGYTRGTAGVDGLTAAMLDCDCADPGDLDRVLQHLRVRGLAYLAYTSWSHGSPNKTHKDTGRQGPFDCFRVVLPYSRIVTPDEHRAIVPALYGREVPALGHYRDEVHGRTVPTAGGRERAALPRGWDAVASRPSQAYYAPCAHSDLEVHRGEPVDVQAVLRRPTTARVSAARARPYRPPTPHAVSALAEISVRMEASSGVGLGPANPEGWCRGPCPSCAPDGEQSSPSFTARANGDSVDMHCHAHCSREDIAEALGLSGHAYDPPSDLLVGLEEQLSAQTPTERGVPVDEAVRLLEADLRIALTTRTPTVLRYPAGTGKSYASAKIIAERVRAGYRVAYATQEHVVAHETRTLLPPDVLARSVHIHSPLIPVGGSSVCERADEVRSQVFEFGASLLGGICPRCPLRATCAARAEAAERAKALSDASAIFVSHAGIEQVFGEGKGADIELIVDEMPGIYERVAVTRAQLEVLSKGVPPSADMFGSAVVRTIAGAWAAYLEPAEVGWGGKSAGSALDLAAEMGRLRVREGVTPRPVERPWLRAADAVVRLAAHVARGGRVAGLNAGSQADVEAMLPDAAHEALVRRRGVLLSATPLMAALPGFELRDVAVQDSAPVTRKVVLREGRGSAALKSSFIDPVSGWRVQATPEEGEVGIPWPDVEQAVERAKYEASRYDPPRLLFVTFKVVADAMRARGGWGDIEIAHFGALRGKNDWKEGAPREVSVVYCFGTPRFDLAPTLHALGYSGPALHQAWADYAAGELTQAEGRLRLPRRTRACAVLVEGLIVPLDWHHENLDEIVEAPWPIPTPSEVAERDAWWGEPLRSVGHAMGLLAAMSPEKKKLLLRSL